MLKNHLHFVIFAFFRRIVNKMGLEHYEFKVSINGKNEKMHVMITRKLCEDTEQSKMDMETIGKYLE